MKKEKISAIIICWNDGEIISRALDSIKGIVDEIIILHDGPCANSTLDIARKYTQKIFIMKRKTRASLYLIDAMKKAKNDWILKIDCDEYLSKDLQKNINKLAQDKTVSAYKFWWPIWNGKKYVTKNWPNKKAMFRKSKVSFFEFPGRDEPDTTGKEITTDYLLEHRPKKGKNDSFWSLKDSWNKAINRYGRSQIEWTLKDFDSLRKYNCKLSDYPLATRVRRNFPLLSAIPFGIMAFLKTILRIPAWGQGARTILKDSIKNGIVYTWIGWSIFKLKNSKDLTQTNKARDTYFSKSHQNN